MPICEVLQAIRGAVQERANFLIGPSGFSLRALKQGSQGLPMWSKGVLDYDSVICCFKEVKTTDKILIILAF